MPFHRHKNAAPATNIAYQQNLAGAPVITTLQPIQTTTVQTTTLQTAPMQPGFPLQTMPMQQGALVVQQQGYAQQGYVQQGYAAGAPLPLVQAPLTQQSILTKETYATTGISTQMASTTLNAGVSKQTIVRPAIIQETVRTDTLVEVQPILHREIDQQRIHHVEQHITERAAPAMGGTVTLAPIVQETVRTNIVEEVQPIVHREVATRHVERVEEHLTERVAAPTVHTTGLALGAGQVNATIAKPAIIDERIRTDRLVEIQPVVHREIEQPRIHHVEQHITERAAPAMGGTVKLAPIIQETVRTNVIEEVQPVIHRERAVQQVQRVEEHLSERLAAPVVHTAGAALGQREIHSTVARPAIIDERIRTDRLVEIQPVVHREIEQQRVHHIEQHITERAAPAMGGTVKLAPIVQETVRTNVVEEVQPVIHRERAVRAVERVEEHVSERIAAPAIHTTGLPLGERELHTTVAKPAIIDQRLRTDRLVEIQPVVHREIEQQRVHHVEQHITEAPAPSMSGVVKMAPVIQQTVRTNVIEEVQPVIHREIATRSIERVEEHLTERVVAPVQHTHEVKNTSTVTIATLPATQSTTVLTQVNTAPLSLNNNLALNQGLPLNNLALNQGLPLNNNLAMNNRVAADLQAAAIDNDLAMREKAALNGTTARPAFAAGGPTPVASNLARPL